MTAAEALETIKQLGAAGTVACAGGDIQIAMGGLDLDGEGLNDALARASSCEDCPVGWRVYTTGFQGQAIVVELRLGSYPTVISLGPKP
jgi:hypothetical protein